MKIAYTMTGQRGDIDQLLLQLAQTLQGQGHRPAGIVQINTERDCDGPCDMDVKVLPDGPVLRISQSLGRGSKGYRLDPGALEAAVGHVDRSLAKQPYCLIVNKFGKQEAGGAGFRDVIAEALSRGIPVLVGLNPLNAPAFEDFSAGLAIELKPAEDNLLRWLKEPSLKAERTA